MSSSSVPRHVTVIGVCKVCYSKAAAHLRLHSRIADGGRPARHRASHEQHFCCADAGVVEKDRCPLQRSAQGKVVPAIAHVHLRAHSRKASDVQVHGPRPDVAAARQRHGHVPKPREQGTCRCAQWHHDGTRMIRVPDLYLVLGCRSSLTGWHKGLACQAATVADGCCRRGCSCCLQGSHVAPHDADTHREHPEREEARLQSGRTNEAAAQGGHREHPT